MEPSERQPENRDPEEGNGRSQAKPPPRRSNFNAWLMIIALAVLVVMLISSRGVERSTVDYEFFLEQVKSGNVEEVVIVDGVARGKFKERPLQPERLNDEGKREQPKNRDGEPARYRKDFRVVIPAVLADEQKNELYATLNGFPPDYVAEYKATHEGAAPKTPKYKVNWSAEQPTDNSGFILLLSIAVPVLLFIFLWMMFRRTREQIMGGGGFLSGFSKSPAKQFEPSTKRTTFNDVAGLEGVKADLLEIVEFLKSPEKFHKLGGRVPKGVLLNGPPGTGKTLLARAVAGEAGVPFYTVSGSEFIQMFVGVGASRVRDLFRTAKENSPSIVFIDEIDAVGRQRGAGLGGGHDEREQTLNQILNEMDGFSPNESVIVMAATNRPDVLDPALLRPGRFDRHVTVDRPTQKGRVEIFKVHVRDVPLADDVDLDRMASGTVGLTGADIRNLVNEAALWAARQNKSKVDMDDFEYARDKVLMGPKREEVLLEKEKEKTAYHEIGHTLLAWLAPGADRVHKVTIIPRGRALGATQTLPSEDRLSMSETELQAHLLVLLAGRAAEQLVYDELTIGAENDLERASRIARRMVTHWGMSERLGPVSYKLSEEDPFLGREMHQQREFSEHTMEVIDEEVARILHGAADKALGLLTENRDKLELLTRELLKQEVLDEKEIRDLIGPSVQMKLAESNGKPHEEKRVEIGPVDDPEASDIAPAKESKNVGSPPADSGEK